MSFRRYESYKDSGVEWLGEVPEHWEVVRLKTLLAEVDNRAGDQDLELLGLSKSLGIVRRSELEQGASASDNYAKYKIVTSGQLVMNKMQAWNEVFGLSPVTGTVSPDYAVFRFMKEGLDKYLCSLFRTEIMSGVFFTRCRGMGTAFLRLNTPDLFDIKVPLPTPADAAYISAFLDRETAKIDALIAEQQRLIELLKEKRQAVISHAVTKGLNPNAPMKDSGIEWLGEVPKHWVTKKIGAISSLKGRLGWQGLKADEYRDHGPYVVSSAHFDNHQINWDACPRVSEERYEIDSNIQLSPNDILLMKDGAAMGKLAFIDNLPSPACLNSHLLLFRPINVGGDETYLPKFAFYYMQTGYFQEFIKVNGIGATFLGISQEAIGRYQITMPPHSEQIAISAFLDSETAKLDTLTTEAKTAIILLQERRTALISAAVTGKIDVRGLA